MDRTELIIKELQRMLKNHEKKELTLRRKTENIIREIERGKFNIQNIYNNSKVRDKNIDLNNLISLAMNLDRLHLVGQLK